MNNQFIKTFLSKPWIKEMMTEIQDVKNTPIIVYNIERIKENIYTFKNGFNRNKGGVRLFYAIKACYLNSIVKTIYDTGCSIEVMSEMEYLLAKRLGVDSSKIIVNGPGKTFEFLSRLVQDKVYSINCDSVSEVKDIIRISDQQNESIGIGIRVQPPSCEGSFLERGGKLGLDMYGKEVNECLELIHNSKNVYLKGIHYHTYINERHREEMINTASLVIDFINDRRLQISYLDIGGGFATLSCWNNDFLLFSKEIGKMMDALLPNTELILEPGRALVNDSAIAIASVIRRKDGELGNWLIVNCNSNVLIPLTNAEYHVISVRVAKETRMFSVGDSLCSASGVYDTNVVLPSDIKEGERVIILNVGAYTVNLFEAFGGNHPSIFKYEEGQLTLIRQRKTDDALIQDFL